MTNFDELLNSFQPQETAQQDTVIDFFNPTPVQREPTPEERDLERLEGDIREIFGTRQFINKVLAGLLGVIGSSAGIHLFARLGIPAIASSTLGGVVIALAFGNALTSIRIEQGRPHIDGEFFLNLAQALGITGSMWVGAQEYRELSGLAAKGKSEFLTEVKNFEVAPQPPERARMGMVGIGVALLIVAIAVLKGKRNG
jgi:hypothetical protein